MNKQSTSEERERQAQQLKEAIDRLRKDESENQREQLKRTISPKAKRPKKRNG